MTPAIDYLITNNLIKEWLIVPCSLFLYQKNDFNKIVLTINEEFNASNYYSVKHWNLSSCSQDHVLPSMHEYRVLKKEIFNHPATIIAGFDIIKYQQEPIESYHNEYSHPMSFELYSYFYENSLRSVWHNKIRKNWLWSQFIFIYLPNLYDQYSYINTVLRSNATIAHEQRTLVNNKMKKHWKFWMLWEKYFLLNPGELMFYKEYTNQNN
jgi:hypothetical protein